MVPPKKNSATAIMSNGSTKLHKFGGGSGSSSGEMSHKKDSSDGRKENRSQNASGSFAIDKAISGNRAVGERPLQRWVPDSAPSQDLSLESSSNGRQWDQFAVNEQKFGLKTDYDPNIYTTTINKKDPNYQKRVERADKIAREIEGSVANNSHVAEERVTDNFAGETGMDEEAKFSSVQRQHDFPPLTSNRADKYTPPARRPPIGQSTASGASVDPAIISSLLARPDKLPSDKTRIATTPVQAASKIEKPASRPDSPATNAAAAAAKTENRATPTASGSAAKPAPSQAKIPTLLNAPMSAVSNGATTAAAPNATATIERDVSAQFKTFAAAQRSQISQTRKDKLKQDKDSKLTELKKFSATFKLTSVVPPDLIPIIAKDPKKQKEIQERSKRDAEAKAQSDAAAKVVAPVAPSSDLKAPKPSAPQAAAAANIPNNRQHSGRSQGFAAQGAYPQLNRNHQGQVNSNQHQHGRQSNGGGLNPKIRGVEGAKYMQNPAYDPRMSLGNQNRLPPTGPSMPNGDSRRSSGLPFAPKLNPNTAEFRPTTSFTGPNANPSVTSSPRSGGPAAQQPPVPKKVLRCKPLPASQRPSFIKDSDILERLKKTPHPTGKDYSFNGGIQAPYDTPPVYKSDPSDLAPEKRMVESFSKIFESAAAVLPMSPAQPSHATPQVPHQHQLPFHLQQGAHAHAMPPRPSPRQHPLQMPHHFQQGQPLPYNNNNNNNNNNNDDHRMVPSHSQQNYQSPRLGNVPMNYPSPMPQNAQMAHQFQPGMQFPIAGGPAPLNRSYSGNSGPQFYPPPMMGGPPVMMQNPANGGYMGPHMVPGQMPMHTPGPYYMQQPGNGPAPMPSANGGYPSPGRGGAQMMTQGSHQGQPGAPVYSLSPSMPFHQPVPGAYPGQQPGPMGNMRGGGFGPGNFGTSPQQMYHMNQQNRGPGGHYNNNNNNGSKNYHPQHHTPAQQHQVPSVQSRPVEAGEEAK